MNRFFTALAFFALIGPGMAHAQAAPFGVAQPDGKLPVEVTSDSLTVKDDENTAIFTGNVIIGQGEMRLTAPRVVVTYLPDQSGIERAHAEGGVTLVSGGDAAEGREADYVLNDGVIVMTGDVLLTRDNNAVTGDRIVVDTRAGTAHVTGRVKTVLNPKTQN